MLRANCSRKYEARGSKVDAQLRTCRLQYIQAGAEKKPLASAVSIQAQYRSLILALLRFFLFFIFFSFVCFVAQCDLY
jgi:hypothetical protein